MRLTDKDFFKKMDELKGKPRKLSYVRSVYALWKHEKIITDYNKSFIMGEMNSHNKFMWKPVAEDKQRKFNPHDVKNFPQEHKSKLKKITTYYDKYGYITDQHLEFIDVLAR